MKYCILLLLIILSLVSLSSTSDTALNADLDYDGNDETIKLFHNAEYPEFQLIINDSAVSDTFIEGFLA